MYLARHFSEFALGIHENPKSLQAQTVDVPNPPSSNNIASEPELEPEGPETSKQRILGADNLAPGNDARSAR